RPGGELRSDSPLLAALRAADEAVGNQSRIERSSTDANVPLSAGIDAIAIGAGGNGGGAHSLQAWYEPPGPPLGLTPPLPPPRRAAAPTPLLPPLLAFSAPPENHPKRPLLPPLFGGPPFGGGPPLQPRRCLPRSPLPNNPPPNPPPPSSTKTLTSTPTTPHNP